jgi:hypothetical protein
MHPTLYGVIAYEDASAAKLAKEKWDNMVQPLKQTYEFELRLWNFDLLRIPELREAAALDAGKAQMIFVVTHGAGELPLAVKTWVEQWLGQRDQKQDAPRLLTLLFEVSTDESWASGFTQFAYLQRAARKGSMDFMASATPTPAFQKAAGLRAVREDRRVWADNLIPARQVVGAGAL